MLGTHPFRVGDTIVVRNYASVTDETFIHGRVRYIDGSQDDFEIDVTHPTGNRAGVSSEMADPFKQDGWVEHLASRSAENERGLQYLFIYVKDRALQFPLFSGYIGARRIALGVHEDSLDGRGRVSWLPVADDIAPANIVENLAVARAFRKIYGFVWYYHASGDTADRTLRASIRDVGDGLPTGMTSGAKTTHRFWPNAGVLTLSANQEGYIYVNAVEGEDFAVSADEGSLTIENRSSVSTPFPIWVQGNDIGKMAFTVTAEEAADRHSIYILVEEWIHPT